MNKLITLLLTLLTLGWSQEHWETAVYDNDIWSYYPAVAEPPADWMNPDFDDTAWLQGTGGIGFGDNDDGTIISGVSAVYIRTTFSIPSLDQITAGLLHYDYDDGFIAYLNGQELFRSPNMGTPGSFVAFDEGMNLGHEANMYRDQLPGMKQIGGDLLPTLIHAGENVLAVQVQNISASSSDLTGRFWLSFNIMDASTMFGEVPEWFFSPQPFTSLLPLVLIDTEGQTIPDEPKIHSMMRVIDNGPGMENNITDPSTGYNGHIGIEIRGASSQMYPKKQYAVETRDEAGENLNVELMGFPSENDWILHAPYSDKTLIRNDLVYTLARQTGNYASRTKAFELFINDEYQGVYILMEKIKRDNNRIDIAKLNPDEIEGDDLTGGYIIKVDKWAGENTDRWFSEPSLPEYGGVYYQYHYPAADDIAPEQESYIQNYIDEFEQMFEDGTYLDPQDGYYNKIDWEQFIDYAIMQEFAKNVDGYRLSSFIYKDKDSNDPRFHTGPVWDFNLAFGNANYYDGSNTVGWYMETNFGDDPWRIPFWWYLIWDDDTFRFAFNARWQELRGDVLSNDHVMDTVDSLVGHLGPAIDRNFDLWPVIGEWVWPNDYIGESYAHELNYLRDWIMSRLIWMDSQTQELGIEAPDNHRVLSAYPNPFNPKQTIQMHISQSGFTRMEILDIRGRVVREISGVADESGLLSLQWDGKSNASTDLPSGVYFLVHQDTYVSNVYKVTLLR
ncbi:MAG: CotH kinase family protein [Candidatus Marinimicrobia bacterium]|nr:CotH kinase family protein [FCB group bacterium]MBL7025071.1 CotH kinase family protein [Candidatus Neomarinimicrobiota bacterium]